MPSELFDPVLELAFTVAQKGNKKKPRVAPPQRLVPMLRFTRMPARARQTIHDVLDTDPEFRARVLESADERSVGRIGMAFLERGDGWEELIARFVEVAEEPILDRTGDTRKLEHRLGVAERSVARLETELEDARAEAAEWKQRAISAEASAGADADEVERLRNEAEQRADERQRAVAELKQTELVMARHVMERKLVERQLADMTAAQLSTVADGGAIADSEVRERADRLRGMVTALSAEVAELRDRATPSRTVVDRRTPMPLPPGMHDDSDEAFDYLLRIPGMLVMVDGYNVTRTNHDDWSLEEQREWLAQGLRSLAARAGADFDVVFDGADVGVAASGGRDRGVTIRFSPEGVEADDVIIDGVGRVASGRPVLVVSSDRRVRDGARGGGANTASSEQLLNSLA